MVEIGFPYWRDNRDNTGSYPQTWVQPNQDIRERHIKKVRKGILIQFEDDSYSFIATDDECYVKIKEALDKKD